jgi:hypothetical protein
VDKAKDLLLHKVPARIADSPIKSRILNYRTNLGKIVRELRYAGDKGRAARHNAPSKIMERLRSEFPILVTRYKQRGASSTAGREEFREQTEALCNAMLSALPHHDASLLQTATWDAINTELVCDTSDLLS